MAPHSTTFAWKIPWTEEPGGLQSMGSLESDTTEQLPFHFSLSCIGEGNSNPLQCSCLENPRDGGAWWAAVCGVAQSWTWLSNLAAAAAGSLNHRNLLSYSCGGFPTKIIMLYFHLIKFKVFSKFSFDFFDHGLFRSMLFGFQKLAFL